MPFSICALAQGRLWGRDRRQAATHEGRPPQATSLRRGRGPLFPPASSSYSTMTRLSAAGSESLVRRGRAGGTILACCQCMFALSPSTACVRDACASTSLTNGRELPCSSWGQPSPQPGPPFERVLQRLLLFLPCCCSNKHKQVSSQCWSTALAAAAARRRRPWRRATTPWRRSFQAS